MMCFGEADGATADNGDDYYDGNAGVTISRDDVCICVCRAVQ